jgi:TPP-dependent pyruvate/acetoin dehydrogenase alpha subunit
MESVSPSQTVVELPGRTDQVTDDALYRAMFRIRRFEETVLAEFRRGVFAGTTHTYLGQEANAVGVLTHLLPGDTVVGNHRCHGHFLAYGGDMRALFAELMGKETGVCGGLGGSQHLHWRDFYSNGILGSTIPVATGMALAEKFKGTGAVGFAFMGDGTLGEGVVYEALNMASLWSAPLVYVLEDNRIAQTTPVELAVAGDMAGRFRSFDIPTVELDTSDVREILAVAGELVADTRARQVPQALVIHTYRFGPHSKGDDTRPGDLLDQIRRTHDPLTIQGERLDDQDRMRIETQVEEEVARAFQDALADPASES